MSKSGFSRVRRYPVSKARHEFADTLSRVAYGGDWVILQRHGKDVAGFVPATAIHSLIQLLNTTRDALSRGAIDERELGLLMDWKESEVRAARRRVRLSRLARFFRQVWDMTGSLSAGQEWLKTAVPVLENLSPKEIILREGIRRVEDLLAEVEAGLAV